MKNIIIGVCSCVLIGILILTVYTLHGRSIRRQELDHAMMTGMRNVMERVQADTAHAPRSDEELSVMFLQEFLTQIDSNSQVTVHILDADHEKGLLSAEAVLTYVHPIGTTGTVASRQTVILEEYDTEGAKEYCSIVYMVEGKRYKAYYLQAKSSIIVPAEPTLEGKRFVGWRELMGSEVVSLEGRTAEEDCTFVAVFQ